MENTVTYCIDFGEALNYAVFSVCEETDNEFDSFGVCSHCMVALDLVALTLVCVLTVDTDSFAKTLCYYFFCLHIEELILEGRRTCVDN